MDTRWVMMGVQQAEKQDKDEAAQLKGKKRRSKREGEEKIKSGLKKGR